MTHTGPMGFHASPGYSIRREGGCVVSLFGSTRCPRGSVGILDGADRLPVAVRFPAGPRVSLKTVDPPKGNGLGQKKSLFGSSGLGRCQSISPWHPSLLCSVWTEGQ